MEVYFKVCLKMENVGNDNVSEYIMNRQEIFAASVL